MSPLRTFDLWQPLKLECIGHWAQVRFVAHNVDTFTLATLSYHTSIYMFWLWITTTPELSAWQFWAQQMLAIPIAVVATALYKLVHRDIVVIVRQAAYDDAANGRRNRYEHMFRAPRLITLGLVFFFGYTFVPGLPVALGLHLWVMLVSTTPLHPNELQRRKTECEVGHAQPMIS